MKSILFLVLFFFFFALTHAQVGPSLSAGVSEVLFTKGTLDASLIAEIVATKRGEIKSELAKRLILKKFECGSFSSYYYAHRTVNLLLSETNKEVISKGLLENSAELLMVYAFAELYLKELSLRLKDASQPPIDYEMAFVKMMRTYADKDTANVKKINDAFGLQAETATGIQDQRQGETTVREKRLSNAMVDKRVKNHLDEDIRFLSLFKSPYNSYNEARCECVNIAPVHFFVDMVFDILKNNEKVREAGFFRELAVSEDEYIGKSKYYRILNESDHDTKFKEEIGLALVGTNRQLLFNSIDDRVTKIFTFYNTLSSISKKIADDNGLSLEELDSIMKGIPGGETSINADLFKNKVKTLRESLLAVTVELKNENVLAIPQGDRDLLSEMRHLVDDININYYTEVGTLEGYRLHIEKEILPRLSVLNTTTNGSFKQVINAVEGVLDLLRLRGLHGIRIRIDDKDNGFKAADNTVDTKNFFKYYKLYIEIVDVINNLDKVESYLTAFDFVNGIANTFGNEQTRHIAHALSSAYDKYATLEKEANKLSLDVESMAVDLYERFGENNSARFGLYFSVGLNYAFDFDSSKIEVDDQVLSSKFSFVSEKVGLRYKAWDFNRDFSYGKNSFKPLINDIHFLGYLSGLLYQIEFLNSNDQFKSGIYGLGGGMTFFNGLDLNVSYAVPFENTFKDGLWNVSLDIKVTEYLSALRKKKG